MAGSGHIRFEDDGPKPREDVMKPRALEDAEQEPSFAPSSEVSTAERGRDDFQVWLSMSSAASTGLGHL